MRGYTRAQVAQHTAEDDLWLIIRNRGSDQLKVGRLVPPGCCSAAACCGACLPAPHAA